MSILLSGDFHANSKEELRIISKDALLKTYGSEKFDSIKYHIILGDGGFMWPNNKERDKENYKSLCRRHFPILVVLGNHEPIYGIKNIPELDIGIGETVYGINKSPFTAYLKRGKVYTIDGIKFLVLGGALSMDKVIRTPNESWWEQEYWTEQEKEDVFELLKKDNEFDCVISHTGPQRVNKILFEGSSSFYEKYLDEVAYLNDEIDKKIKFRKWFCGHWHKDKSHCEKRKKREYHYLYATTRILENAKIL